MVLDDPGYIQRTQEVVGSGLERFKDLLDFGPGEMAQQLIALVVLPEDPSSIPNLPLDS